MTEALKEFYLRTYGKMDQLEHNVVNPTNVDLLNKFVELTVVDAYDAEKDIVNITERELFLRRQMTYKPIEFYEVFSKERPLVLISGIAGIGKTCLLRKCLLDWASGKLWEKIDLVFHLECRKINQHQTIEKISDLVRVFYKNILKGCNTEQLSKLFVIDGLDEFAYLDELVKYNPQNRKTNPQVVAVLAEALNFKKHRCVVAGRVGAILQYKNKVIECHETLTIQLMGFNDKGVNEYIEKVGDEREAIKDIIKSSKTAKAMASVPFYLSAMCAVIKTYKSSDLYSFVSTTELYCCIFIYFFQKHINKNNEAVHKIMEDESSKQYILKVCKVAWHLFNENKILFTRKEIKEIVDDIDEVEDELSGFIEKVESQLGYQYQFVHLTLMEFCASIHAYINLSLEEILSNKKLRSCLPMICGLENKNEKTFSKFFANFKISNEQSDSNNSMHSMYSMFEKMHLFFADMLYSHEEISSLLHAVLALVPKGTDYSDQKDRKIFMECFFEAQASITGYFKRSIDEREWKIDINDGKTAHEISHEKYFVEKLIDAKCKLKRLNVNKSVLSEDQKELLILCSMGTHGVYFNIDRPLKIDGWSPKHQIEVVLINVKNSFLSKKEFEGFFPWIRLAKELYLHLHDDTDFIDGIWEWLCLSSFNRFVINYRGKSFDNNIKDLKQLI